MCGFLKYTVVGSVFWLTAQWFLPKPGRKAVYGTKVPSMTIDGCDVTDRIYKYNTLYCIP